MELRKSLRRKGTTNIRSPAVRRNSSAEVIMKGWLFKLEGSTIKQWKKRWFILSEYCLFYYKGPDEEKCLGSILLPSYKIRPCTGEDKVSHKHAFVAEHQNMKTYYFAAESSTGMCQWMNAMCLASLMQREPQQGVEQCPRPQCESLPPSYEGIHPFRPHPAQYHHHPPPQPHANAHYQPNEAPFDDDTYNAAENGFLLSGEQYPCSYTQSPIYDTRPNKGPVYANAPPKPRRHGATSPTNDPYGLEPPPGAEARVPHGLAQPYGAIDSPKGSVDTRCQYGDQFGKGPLFRPRSADFLERNDDGRESRMRRGSQGKPRPKSSMAHYDWQDEEEDEDVWARYGEGREEGQRRASSDSRPADVCGRFVGARTAVAQSSLGSSLGSVQGKKTAHKEESMKRLLEWKQRMLQSPLRKKQQGALSPDMYGANTSKRPVSSLGLGSSPGRPPLPREYQMKLLKEAEMQESRVTMQQQQNLSAPLPTRQDLRTAPDLIQHAKVSPTKPSAKESPDYVNLRNLQYPATNLRMSHDFQQTGSATHTFRFQQPDQPSCISPHSEVRQSIVPPAPSTQYVPRRTHQHVDHGTDHSPQRATYQNVMRPRSAPYYRNSDGFVDVPPPIQSSTPTEASQAQARCFSPGVEGNTGRWQQRADPVYTKQEQVTPQCYPSPINKAMPKQGESKPVQQYCGYTQDTSVAYAANLPVGDAVLQQSLSRDSLYAQRAKITRQSLSRTESDRSCPESKPTYIADENAGSVVDSMSLRKDVDSPNETSSDMFAIQKEDYYRASQLFYSKQPLSKGLLATVSDVNTQNYEVETFDSRYRKNCNTPKSPEWELDKDIGLPVPDNLDLSFQSTSNNSVFEAPCETPGDQSPEFFQGTLRPTRTYIRDRQSSKEEASNTATSNNTRASSTAPKQKASTEIKNRSFEEMRSTIQKKKEAPPPNIVQDRIKCFETKEGTNVADSPKEVVEGKKCPGDSDDPTPEPDESEDSESSCDVATLKSMHEVQSQDASVLTDLRKTADTKKDEVSRTPSLDDVQTAPKAPASNSLHVPKSSEAHYVPMGGWLTKDADYVTMSIDSSADSKASEPVYNEPMMPVPSFVHDSFNKLSSSTRRNSKDVSGSSSDCSTENIYERVRQSSLTETSPKTTLAMSAAREGSAKVEDIPVYEEPYALVSPSTSNGIVGSTDACFGMFGKENLATKVLTKKPFPDLLHHEEVKDSGASDADDEASRADFDTAPSSLPSYQKEVLNEPLPNTSESLPQPQGLMPQQPYSPVYAVQTTKYSLRRERLLKQETTGITNAKEASSRLTDGAAPTQSAVSPPKTSLSLRSQMSPGQLEKPTSLGLLRNLECDTSSSEAGSLLCVPKGVSKVPEASARPRGTPESLSQVSSPLLSTAPDVLPSEVRTVVSESNSKKSPNSAPYYYSDIFGEKLGQGMSGRQPGQHMRITPNVLNNIREMRINSPTPKGDVGRRVNDISISTPTGLNTSHIRTRSEPEPMTVEFENTIRGLLNPSDTRKFSDAEKNKYIAGHTLEKTSHMTRSVLSGMRKQRSDVRKLEDHGANHTGNMLPRRLSRSLEDVIDVQESTPRSKTPTVGASDTYDEPYYENVGFASASRPQAPRSSAGPQVSVAKHSVYDGEDICGESAVGSMVKNLFANGVDFLGVPPTRSSIANLYGGLSHLQQGSDVATVGSSSVDLGRSDASGGPHAHSGIRQALNNFAKAKEQDHSVYNYSNESLHSYSSECQLDAHNIFEMEMSPSSPSIGLSHSFSAGDLLGKSHKELVLLLIQLRRNHNNLTTSKVRHEMELRALKENIVHSDSKHSATDVQRLVSLQRRLNELNKNLQLTQPLINLVENMVKLGSLYNIASCAKLAGARDSGHANSGADSGDAAETQRAAIEKEIETIRNLLAGGITPGGPSKEDLEVELRRLQTLVDDLLQRKRGLNLPPTPVADNTGKSSKPTHVNLSSTAVSSRKKHERTYYETDLDSGITNDVSTDVVASQAVEISYVADSASTMASPEVGGAAEELSYLSQDINAADDRTKKFYGILPRDRAQEIKTVRIVKRESERRQRGRDHRRKGPLEEGLLTMDGQQETLFYQDQIEQDPSSDDSTKQDAAFEDKVTIEGHTKSEQRMTPSSSADSLSSGGRSPRRNRRSKRRHYTISGSHPFLDQHSPSKVPASLRSRDDMDMERCLRTVNTPDIVRSTIKKSDVYDEQTIDRQIGLPQKILIPERYIEMESENISAVERLRRSLKAANIRKMLTESVAYEDIGARNSVEEVRSKVGEEKRRRAHLLALNHSIAKEVMERSKLVAAHITPLENAQ